MMRDGGYLCIDHRASPGLPADIAGNLAPMLGEGRVFEAGTYTCSHCKCVVMKNPFRIRPREYCRACDHVICDLCARAMDHPDYIHEPFEALVDRVITAALRGA